MTEFADFVGEISWADLKGAGYEGAAGYISHHTAKQPSAGYGASIVADGGFFLPVFEDSATRSTEGYAAGVADAQFADSVMDKWGVPLDAPWAITSDFDATLGQVRPYYQGVFDTTKRKYVVGYLDGDAGRGLKAAGLIKGLWLTCSGGFHGSANHADVDIWQRCTGQNGHVNVPGHSVDTNQLLTNNIPFWGLTQGDLSMADAASLEAQIIALSKQVDRVARAVLIDISTDANEGKGLTIDQRLTRVHAWVRAIGTKDGVTGADAQAQYETLTK